MKNLIVYYSYEGNTKKLVEAITKVIDADVIELKPKNEKVYKGMFRFVWGAKEVYMTKKPKLEEYNVDLSKYSNIILAGPCWFGTYCPPINTFLSDNKFQGKNVYLLMCDGNNLRNTWRDYEKALKGNTIVSKIDFVYPIKNGIEEASKKAQDWITENLIKD